MKYYIMLLATLSVFICSISYGGEELFTWKDDQGGLHITDARPPVGAEILDISPNSLKAAEEVQRQRQIHLESIRQENIRKENQRKNIERQAAAERENKVAAQQAAEEIEKEKAKKRRAKRRRHRNRNPTPPVTTPPDSGGIENFF